MPIVCQLTLARSDGLEVEATVTQWLQLPLTFLTAGDAIRNDNRGTGLCGMRWLQMWAVGALGCACKSRSRSRLPDLVSFYVRFGAFYFAMPTTAFGRDCVKT